MAGEIQFDYRSSVTCYAIIRDREARVWNTSGAGTFESFNAANYASYAVSITEQGGSSYYAGDMPGAISPGVYSIVAKERMGGSPGISDPTVARGDVQWNGVMTLPLSDLVTSGQFGQIAPMRVARGVMLRDFPFKLVSSLDHITPFTSGVVSGQISRDGGNFGPLQSGNVQETGLGWYRVTFTSGDLNANTLALVFTANGISGGTSDQRDFALITQRVSGF